MRLDCGIMSNDEAPLPCHVLEELAFMDQSPKMHSAKGSDEGPLVKQARGQQANPFLTLSSLENERLRRAASVQIVHY